MVNIWYSLVDSELLQQGDLINSCPVITPSSLPVIGSDISVDVDEYNVIIISQSCDLEPRENGKANLDFVVVCPIWDLSEFEEKDQSFKSSNMKERLRRGYQPSYHLLNKCNIKNFETNFMVVNFQQIFSVSFNILTDHAKNMGKRLRLLSPYREHLSQAFARYFMRVGLPSDIPEFSKHI